MFISEAFAQTAPAATAAADSPLGSMGGMIFPLLMVAALYFVVLRPQMKRQKEHKAMIEAVQKGDEIVTAGGIVGEVVHIKEGTDKDGQPAKTLDDRITIRTGESKVVVERGRIAKVVSGSAPQAS